jgi:hypothetical protein
VVRSHQREPEEQNGGDRECRGGARPHASSASAEVSICNRRTGSHLLSMAPEPPRVAAERLAEQGERPDEGHLSQGTRHDSCRRRGKDNPLNRGDDLAPVARRQRLTHPRPDPPGCKERIARRTDREDPRARRAGDVHAEDKDQERVDLAVELRAQLRRRLAASRDPSVDGVQRERDARECHQRCYLCGLREGVGDQRCDADGECPPSKSHPIRRAGQQKSPNRLHMWDRYGSHGAPVRARAEKS